MGESRVCPNAQVVAVSPVSPSLSVRISLCLAVGCAHDKSQQMPNKQIKNPKGATNAKTPFDVGDLLARFFLEML